MTKLTFRNYDNPKEVKEVICFSWYSAAPVRPQTKGHIFARTIQNPSLYIDVENENYYLENVENF